MDATAHRHEAAAPLPEGLRVAIKEWITIMPATRSESKSEAKRDSKARTARRAVSRKPRAIPGSAELRAAMAQRDGLFKEARKDPDSEAGQMVHMFLLSGILAGKAAASRTNPADDPRTAILDGLVLEQRRQLDEIARTAEKAKEEKWDEAAIYNRIATIVGLNRPLQMYQAPEQSSQQPAQPQKPEDTCQMQSSQTPKS